MWKKLKLKRLKRKIEEVQNKLTSLNGSNYISVNWVGGDPPDFARVGGEGSEGYQRMPEQEGCDVQGVHNCVVGVDMAHSHSDGAFIVATVGDESPGMGSLFDNGENTICQSGYSLGYTTGLLDTAWITTTSDHTHGNVTIYDDSSYNVTFEPPGMMPNGKPKVPCAVCGRNLHNPENFPEDFPEDFKLCCNCQAKLEELPIVLKKFERFIGKRKREEWAESG